MLEKLVSGKNFQCKCSTRNLVAMVLTEIKLSEAKYSMLSLGGQKEVFICFIL